MIDLSKVQHHPAISELTEVICSQTRNNDRAYFRTEVAFFLARLASCMRVNVQFTPNDLIPVNLYVLNLGPSGTGKGTSMALMEHKVFGDFKDRFVTETLPQIAEDNLVKLSTNAANIKNTTLDQELAVIQKVYDSLGAYRFDCNGATTPAIKQFRQLLLMSNSGAINAIIDEIGVNLLPNAELMNTYLELFDLGYIKDKLTKSSADNKRIAELDGSTPANLLLFGSPNKLFDGSTTEKTLYEFLEMGYGRRFIFGYGMPDVQRATESEAKEVYLQRIDPKNIQTIDKWRDRFYKLADPINNKFVVEMDEALGIKYTEYQIWCENRSYALPEHMSIQKAEMQHRSFKALKLAGALSFVDGTPQMTEQQLYQAIKLVEEDSGEAFAKIMNRDPPYVKLAKYICSCGKEVTHADLSNDLPFYKTSQNQRNEMMALARAYGANHNYIIKISKKDGIEFFSGETLPENDMKHLIVSSSANWSTDYLNSEVSWNDFVDTFSTAATSNGSPIVWCNHHFVNGAPDSKGLGHGHRQDSDCLAGFNLIGLDVDGTANMAMVQDFLKDYTYMMYSTKSQESTIAEHIWDILEADTSTLNKAQLKAMEKDYRESMKQVDRFRLVLPLSHTLELDAKDYKEFMNGILEWLPFESDEASNQRARVWRTNTNRECLVFTNKGQLFDVLPFVPRTSSNDSYKNNNKNISDMSALERWFYREMENGNRNCNLLKYAYVLKDSGMDFSEIEDHVNNLNRRLPVPLNDTEIKTTILKTIAKEFGRAA